MLRMIHSFLGPGLILWYNLSNGKHMRFSTWNMKRLYKLGSITTVARELQRYKLDLDGVKEVRWDKGDTVR